MAAGQFPRIEDEGSKESPLSSSNLLAGQRTWGMHPRLYVPRRIPATAAATRSPIRLRNTATAAMRKGALRKESPLRTSELYGRPSPCG